MLISDSYKRLNEELHERREDYGSYGGKYRDLIIGMLAHFDGRTFLDYGEGKGTLRKALHDELVKMGIRHKVTLRGYDPAIEAVTADPEPSDIVACTDVLEHIEPDMLADVLAHLGSKIRKAGFLTVATRPAVKILADGRNAHLIQQPWLWWAERIDALMPVSTVNVLGPQEVHFYCVAKEKTNGAGTA